MYRVLLYIIIIIIVCIDHLYKLYNFNFCLFIFSTDIPTLKFNFRTVDLGINFSCKKLSLYLIVVGQVVFDIPILHSLP